MKILYDNQTGKIFARIKDSQWASWAYYHTRIDNGNYWILKPDGSDNVHLPLTLFIIEENSENKALNMDIIHKGNKTDENGDNKYSIKAGNIEEKEDWEEHIEESFI